MRMPSSALRDIDRADGAASLDPKTKLQIWAPSVIADLYANAPNSPTTRSVSCMLTRLLSSSTNSQYLSRDRAQRIFYNNWDDFAELGYVDYARSGVLHAAKWSGDWRAFSRRVIDIDYAVRNGLQRIADINNVWGDASNAARRMHAWAMDLQRRSSAVLGCYR
jgi:hypothetical protein